jgi:hypothetical protein
MVVGLCCWLFVGNCGLAALAGDPQPDKPSMPLSVDLADASKPEGLLAKVDLTKIFDYYSALAVMETKVFGRSYTDDSIEVRLARLEFKLFKKTSPRLSFFERTERLRMATDEKSVEPEMVPAKFPVSALPATPGAQVTPSANHLATAPLSGQPMKAAAKRLAGKLVRQGIRRGIKMAVHGPSSPQLSMGLRMAGLAGAVAGLAVISVRSSGVGGRP